MGFFGITSQKLKDDQQFRVLFVHHHKLLISLIFPHNDPSAAKTNLHNMKNYPQLVKFSMLVLVISGLNMACAARLGPAYITGYSYVKQPSPQTIIAVPLKSTRVTQPETEPKLDIQAKLKFTLDSVFFEVDKANLLPKSHLKIDEFVTSIQRYGPTSIVQIEGHTDDMGEEIYNQYLSEDRAETVRDALITKGIDPDMLFVQGFGESNPLTTNTTKEGRQQNRRVDITVIK